jgi:hypothetical protein
MGAVRIPQDIEHLRILYERQGRSVVEISAATGVPVKSIRHYARTRDWRRGAASPPGPDELIARMWVALGRRIALVEKDPGATPARDFISLSHALRDLAACRAGAGARRAGRRIRRAARARRKCSEPNSSRGSNASSRADEGEIASMRRAA